MTRLLLVDDDELVRKAMSLYFRRAGWEIETAEDVEKALALLESPFDVVVCDLHLSASQPAEGLEVLAAARRLLPNAPCVLLSGDGGVELGDVEPDAVLQKPVRMAELERRLKALLGREGES